MILSLGFFSGLCHRPFTKQALYECDPFDVPYAVLFAMRVTRLVNRKKKWLEVPFAVINTIQVKTWISHSRSGFVSRNSGDFSCRKLISGWINQRHQAVELRRIKWRSVFKPRKVVAYSSMQYRKVFPRKKSCFPTRAGEASNSSFKRLVANTLKRGLFSITNVTPSRDVK